MSHCKYHPLTPARYYCRYCRINTCNQCCDEPATASDEVQRRCFTCSQPITDLGSAHTVEPFWRRLNKIYGYGFSSNAMIMIIGCSLLTALSFYSAWLILIPSILMTRYSFNCLQQTALGELHAPTISSSFSGGIVLLLQLIAIVFIAGGLISVGGNYLGQEMGVLIGLLVLFVLPAVFILLAINDTLGEAINPGNIGQLIAATGATYIIMLLFVFVMMASVGVLNALIGDGHREIQFFAQNLVSNYYTVVVFHLMGYLVFQKQEALGYYAADSDLAREPRSQFEIEQARIEVLVKEGQYQLALETYRDLLPKNPNNLALWEKCLRLMCQVGKPEQLTRFADQMMPKLLDRDDEFYIAKVYREITLRAPNYRPSQGRSKIRLAETLFHLRDYKGAIKLLNQFHKLHPDKQEICRAYDLLANALDHLPNMEQKAQNYRQFIQQMERSMASSTS